MVAMKQQSSRRPRKVAQSIQREIASLLLLDVKDPHVRNVTITGVTVSKDLTVARVRFLVLGTGQEPDEMAERMRAEASEGLERAKGFLRREVGRRVGLRVVPDLRFHWDQGIEHRRRMDDIIAEIAADRGPVALEGEEEPT